MIHNLFPALYSWENGAFVMVGVFSLVLVGIVGVVWLMMTTDKKKKD